MVNKRGALVAAMTATILSVTAGLNFFGTALADVLPANDPLMKLATLKAACVDQIKQQLDDPSSMQLVQYGGFATADHSYLATAGRKWIPIKIRFKNADGSDMGGDWVCSFHMLTGAPTDLAAFAQRLTSPIGSAGSLRQTLELSLGESALGLKSADLTSMRMHALSALDYMRAVRADWSFLSATGTITRSPKPHHAVVMLTRGEIRVSQLEGAKVRKRQAGEIGRITDMVVDTEPRVVCLVALKSMRSEGSTLAFRWSELKLSPAARPNSGFVSSLPADAAAAAPQFADEVHAQPSYVDVERNLIGRPVIAAGGATVGKVVDLVIDLRSGAVDYILVSGNSVLGVTAAPLALRWTAIADLRIEHDIILTLDETQLAAAPVFLSR